MKRSIAVTASGLAALALLVCGASFAQQPPSNPPAITFSYIGGAQEASFVSDVVKNAPYSATQTRQTTQTLADGTHITNNSTTIMYRDSAGRTRAEMNGEIATINDPVGGATYRLDLKSQTASTIRIMNQLTVDGTKSQLDGVQAQLAELQAELQAKAAAISSQVTTNAVTNNQGTTVTYTTSTGDGVLTLNDGGRGGAGNPPEIVKESLGTQTMEGVLVEGTRVTRTIPVGSMGNDRPITTVTERWYSPDLRLYVMTKTTDPRNGETIVQMTGVNRAEPDASLFQIPANYKIVSGVGGGGGGTRGGRNN
jgi:hypothetical protein